MTWLIKKLKVDLRLIIQQNEQIKMHKNTDQN